jgi:hypothetical protein
VRPVLSAIRTFPDTPADRRVRLPEPLGDR